MVPEAHILIPFDVHGHYVNLAGHCLLIKGDKLVGALGFKATEECTPPRRKDPAFMLRRHSATPCHSQYDSHGR